MAYMRNKIFEQYQSGARQHRRRRSVKSRRRRRLRALIILAMFLVAALIVGLIAWGLIHLLRNGSGGAVASTAASSATLTATSPAQPDTGQTVPGTGNPYYEPGTPPLINRDNHIPEGYAPELTNVGYGNGREQQMEARAASAYLDMVAAAASDGIGMSPYSGYRSHERQQNNYNAAIQSYLVQGYSQAEAEAQTQLYYAIPGTSEHEAGLAMDIDGTNESFANTPAFQWLRENAAGFGFIMRYGKDDTDITHVAYEPWHWRYVGANHAAEIVRQGITLEEYVAGLAGR